jgi:hypothetical protein
VDYPKQEGASGNSQRATVAKRDIVTIYQDAAPGGASNPEYTQLLGENIPAEVLQVAGGESVRGKQVEAGTSYVVSINWVNGLNLNAKCSVVVGSGFYAGQVLYTRRIHVETDRSRPKAFQLHCGTRE